MHQPYRVRKILTPISLIRAVLLCLLLLGSQLSISAGLLAGVKAAGYSHGRGIVHSLITPQMRTTKPQIIKKTGLAALGPDLSVSMSQSSSALKNGQPVTFTAAIINLASASSALAAPTALITLPVGFTHISAASAGGWSFVTSGPVISATYTGALPILPGHVLPSISISAMPTVAHTGNLARLQAASIVVSEVGDVNLANNSASIQATVADMRTAAPITGAKKSLDETPTVVPTSTVDVTPTVNVTPTAVPSGIDLAISKVASASSFAVGQTITYTLTVSSTGTDAVTLGTPIGISDTLPVGLTDVSVSSNSDWSVSSSSTTSPCVISANYAGTYPVAAGSTLSSITITGTVAPTASNPYVNTAAVLVPGDINSSNDSSTSSVMVTSGAAPTAVAGSPTATSTETPVAGSPTATSTETPVAGSPTATSTETPVAGSPTATSTETPVAGSPTATSTETSIAGSPTSVATSSPTAVGTASPIAVAAPAAPVLDIAQSHLGASDVFSIGDTISYVVNVSNEASAGPETQPITLFDLVPVGLTNITATGTQWNVNVANTTSPSAILATYTGTYPVAPGAVLPPLTISGTLTSVAGPTFTNTVIASSSDYQNPSHSASYVTITVASAPASVPGAPVGSPTPGGPGSPVGSPTSGEPVGAVGSPTSGEPVGTGGSGVDQGKKGPDLQIIKSSLDGNHFRVGDDVTFFIAVSNVSDSGSVNDSSTISVEDVIPIGLTNIHVNGQHWHFKVSDHTSPSVIDANFTGTDQLNPGQTLPVITITGRLTNDAVPSLTDTATVDVEGDSNTNNNTVMYTIFVKKQHHQQHHQQHEQQQEQQQHQRRNNRFFNAHGAAFGAGACGGAGGFPCMPPTGSDPNPRLKR